MVETKKFFSLYGTVFIIYVPIYLICRFFTVFVFGTGWKVGVLEWIFFGAVIVVFLQFIVMIFIPNSIIFFGDRLLGKNR